MTLHGLLNENYTKLVFNKNFMDRRHRVDSTQVLVTSPKFRLMVPKLILPKLILHSVYLTKGMIDSTHWLYLPSNRNFG